MEAWDVGQRKNAVLVRILQFRTQQEQQKDCHHQSQLLCRLLFGCPFHPRSNTVVHKRPQSFCQKCWRQVMVELTYTLDPAKTQSGLTMLSWEPIGNKTRLHTTCVLCPGLWRKVKKKGCLLAQHHNCSKILWYSHSLL